MSTSDHSGISVVIPCYDEGRTVAACLRSLAAQQVPPREIIVVDDGSTDDSRQQVAAFAEHSPVPIIALDGPHRGVSHARNLGAARARGPLLIFAEADATYSLNYLAAAAAALADPSVGGAQGGLRAVWGDRETVISRAWDHLYRARWDLTRTGRSRPLGAWAFRLADFRSAGGYDEDLRVGEDCDLALRIRALGIRLAYFSEGEVHHRDPAGLMGTWRRFYWGGRHSLPFRRRWGRVRRDVGISLLMVAALAAACLLLVWGASAGLLLLILLCASPLLFREVRSAVAQAHRAGDPLSAFVLPPLYYSTKLASAIGILVARLAELVATPRRRSNRERAIMKRVDFLAWQPVSNATARCRGADYARELPRYGYTLHFRPPAPEALSRLLRGVPGFLRLPGKLLYFLIVIPIRLWQVVRARRAYAAVIQRELYPFGPPLLERLLARLQPHLVYDFDDAVDLAPPHLSRLAARLRNDEKFHTIARLCRHLIASTPLLAERAEGSGRPITIIPTPVDTQRIVPAVRPPRATPTLGWIGTGGNLFYLQTIARALREIQTRFGCRVVVVSAWDFHAAGLEVTNVRWRLDAECAQLQDFDIGLMPLVDNEYTRAKGGYKILQYWAAGVATVASPVGFNAQLIDPGIDGLLASGTAEWTQALQSLVEDPDLRCRLAAAGRAKVEREYSLAKSAPRLADVLDRVSSEE